MSPCLPLPTHSPANCLKRSKAAFLSAVFFPSWACDPTAHANKARHRDHAICFFMTWHLSGKLVKNPASDMQESLNADDYALSRIGKQSRLDGYPDFGSAHSRLGIKLFRVTFETRRACRLVTRIRITWARANQRV